MHGSNKDTQSTIHQDSNKRPRNRSNRAPLAPGDARHCGCVLLSCYKAKEGQATREAMTMLGDLCEELYGSTPSHAAAAGDVLGDLAAEAAAFRKGTGEAAAWFRPVRIKNNCMGVIAVNPAHPQAAQVDVLHVVDTAFRRMVAAGQGNTRKVLRMWPLPSPVFPLALPVVRLASQQLQQLLERTIADGSFPSERPVRVAISFKARSVAAPSADKLQLMTSMPPPSSTQDAAVAATASSTAVTSNGTSSQLASAPAPAAAASLGQEAQATAPAPAAAASLGQEAQATASDEPNEGTLMTRDAVTPLMCEEVKRIMGEHELPFVLVYKDEHITLELQALQSIAGAYAVLTSQHEAAARFNMQKLPSASVKKVDAADAASASVQHNDVTKSAAKPAE